MGVTGVKFNFKKFFQLVIMNYDMNVLYCTSYIMIISACVLADPGFYRYYGNQTKANVISKHCVKIFT